MQLFALTVLSMGIHLIDKKKKPCILNSHVFVLVPWCFTAGLLLKACCSLSDTPPMQHPCNKWIPYLLKSSFTL